MTARELRWWLASQIDPEPYRVAKERMDAIWCWDEAHPGLLSISRHEIHSLCAHAERQYRQLLAFIDQYREAA